VDIDECVGAAHDCVSREACVNAPGTFACRCPPGQLGDGRSGGAGCIDLGGLVLWLDAADPLDNLRPPESGALPIWADRSGNGHPAGQPVSQQQPTYVSGAYGRGAVRFDGHPGSFADELAVDNSSRAFDLVDASVFTVLARLTASDLAPPGFFAVRDPVTTRISLHLSHDALGWDIWNGTTLTYTREAGFEVGRLYLLDAIWSGGLEVRRTNGRVLEMVDHPWNAGAIGLPVHVGWSGGLPQEHFAGSIAELVIFDHALDEAGRDRVTRYLRDKWALLGVE
jgi:hypothetical protein